MTCSRLEGVLFGGVQFYTEEESALSISMKRFTLTLVFNSGAVGAPALRRSWGFS